MSDIFKFPKGGYDVTICRKREVIEELDITNEDKDLMLAVVTQCEQDAIGFLKEGRWTGIPYLGNMRIPEYKKKFKEISGVELLETAKENLDEQRYKAFRKELNANIAVDVKQERLYKYRTSCFVTKHRSTYNRFLKDIRASKLTNKDAFARFMCYSLIEIEGCIHTD